MDRRIGRIEAALVGDAERRSRAREVPTDVTQLQDELDTVLAEIRTLSEALGAELPPAPEAAKPMRGRLGALRQQQAAILFRMGPSAPGGVFPPGDNALLQR
jgi:adenosyl cobinamide kinase/adenosyl cobinamide phosphate guanylyltransferase